MRSFIIKAASALLIIPAALTAVSAAEKKISPDNADWIWFFYEKTADAETRSVVYRPFYMDTVSPELEFDASLMPFIFTRYRTERYNNVTGLLGLYYSVDYNQNKSSEDYDTGLFPLFMYGEGTSASDNYLLVYPAGGTMKGKFAYERISPWVFPGFLLFFVFPPPGIFTLQTLLLGIVSLVPVYTEFEDGDYSGTALFWPLIAWGGDESGKRKTFRVLPFYSHKSKEGWYDTYSYLLLINYRETYLKDDTRYTFFFFPFYGTKWSREDKVTSHTVLWPFFSWGYDSVTNDREYNLPWPLVQIRDCDNPRVRKRIFFPFYGRYTAENYESFFVTPLYFRITDESADVKAAYHVSCFLFWYFKRDYSYTHDFYGRSWRYFKAWPLVQVEWSDSGFYSLNVLSLLPFRDTAGYERMYQPFWSLFEYRVRPDGVKHMGILLRTYYQVWGADFMKIKVPLLLNYTSRGGGVTEFCMLAHAFGYVKKSGGSYLRLFWIPVRVGEGTGVEAAEAPGSGDDYGENSFAYTGFSSEHGDFNSYNMGNSIYASVRF
ncbi:MAG TPA: hypothetical protein PK514_04805 [Spirochaetota bacterium]|nr:hypothetical protein [Spirochaetota bacterium]